MTTGILDGRFRTIGVSFGSEKTDKIRCSIFESLSFVCVRETVQLVAVRFPVLHHQYILSLGYVKSYLVLVRFAMIASDELSGLD
jgi:hypothetical protein